MVGVGLGLDLETTSLDTEKAKITEVGLIRCSLPGFHPIDVHSWLVTQSADDIEPDAMACNGIDAVTLATYGYGEGAVLTRLGKLMEDVDYIIAYNGRAYDKKVYETNCRRLGIAPVEKPWLDPLEDIDFPVTIHGRKLVHVTAEHGFVNPFPHRAVFDVVAMLKLCSMYDTDTLITNANTPRVELEALVTFAQKDLAKRLRYQWDVGTKRWIKSVRKTDIVMAQEIEAAEKAGFRVRVL